jgi:hypothetical protein
MLEFEENPVSKFVEKQVSENAIWGLAIVLSHLEIVPDGFPAIRYFVVGLTIRFNLI